jgi:hypothetical protein
MAVLRILLALMILVVPSIGAPASAQFFLKNPDLSGPPLNGDEALLGYSLPDATPAELRAGMVWSMRAGLNVAALQCQFEPTLLSVTNYNAILTDHKAELSKTLDTLTKYFTRTGKSKAQGLSSLDRFGTRLYSSFSVVTAQYIFCLTASAIARDALAAPRGKFGDLAVARIGELRRALVPAGEQRFPGSAPLQDVWVPRLDPQCWVKDYVWNTKKCGKPDKIG